MSRIINFGKKVIMIVAFTMTAAVCLAGCDSNGSKNNGKEAQHVAVIMSNTKNEGIIDTTSLMNDMTVLAKASGSTVSYFNCDGNPEYIDTLTIPEYKNGISDAKIKQLAEEYASQIVTAFTNLIPNDEELDIFKAISLAARQLQQYEGEKTLYIASSGISTSGLVNFTELYLEKDHSDELVEVLQNELPDLSDVKKVIWFGMGETTGEQADLYESNRKILENTWKKILVAAGVDEDDIVFSTALSVNTDDKSKDLPYVGVVPISCTVADIADIDFEVEAEELGGLNKSEGVSNNNGTFLDLSDRVSFKSDSTELLTNEDEVVESLSKIIGYLKEDDSRQILLVGTTSSWGEEDSLRQFSLKRCETIKNVLISQGVYEGQIQCVGAGYDNNLTVNDRADDGTLVNELAEQNRTVYLFTNAKSTAAQKILDKFS